jgi:sugar lactone lactonase YvrE
MGLATPRHETTPAHSSAPRGLGQTRLQNKTPPAEQKSISALEIIRCFHPPETRCIFERPDSSIEGGHTPFAPELIRPIFIERTSNPHRTHPLAMRMIIPLVLFLVFGIAPSPARADRFVTGQAAASVLGQTDFNSGSSGNAPHRFQNPESVAIDPVTGKVFVADSGHYRILRFSGAAALLNGSFPEAVIGQPNFSTTLQNQGGLPGPNTLNFVYQITVDSNGRLWVCDSGNNRVLCFVAASFLGNNPPADYVFGQPDFTTVSPGTTIAKADYPAGIAVGPDDSLWVADADNNRVLRFANISSKSSGADADQVLGQANFVTDASATTATGMYSPFSLSVDSGGRLWVADTYNHRVLRFDNAASLANGSPASGVLGQVLLTTSSNGTSADQFLDPYGVLAGPDGTVYVGDWGNERVMGFRNAAVVGDGASANFVLGKPDFNTNIGGPSATLTGGVVNLALSAAGELFVADYGFHRVVRFSPVKSPTLQVLTKTRTTKATELRVVGTAGGAVTSVVWRVGASGPFKTASGTTSWNFKTKLKRGKNVITVVAIGPGGDSAPRVFSVRRK